jgi:bisphosphoglycerate-dependent phosphoglycerate mutase
MKSATQICVTRHGETGWNVAQILQGWSDVAVDELGRRQAVVANTIVLRIVGMPADIGLRNAGLRARHAHWARNTGFVSRPR